MASRYQRSTAIRYEQWCLGILEQGTFVSTDVVNMYGAGLNHAQHRSVKWLARITAIAQPSNAPVQKKEYLYYTPQTGKHNASYSSGFSIQDMPVSSAIISPVTAAVIIHDGTIKMRGWAYSGGGHWPERVEVSGDGGSVWYETPYEKLSQKYFHAWRLWEIDLPVDAEGWYVSHLQLWTLNLDC